MTANVIQLKKKVVKAHRGDALRELLRKQESGELLGHIHIASTADGDSYAVTGSYADRLQYAAMAMIRALNEIADKIRESGSAGHTASVALRKKLPGRTVMPSELAKPSNFGTLN